MGTDCSPNCDLLIREFSTSLLAFAMDNCSENFLSIDLSRTQEKNAYQIRSTDVMPAENSLKWK